MKRIYAIFLLPLLFLNSFNAQEVLPKGLTAEEKLLLPNYKFSAEKRTPPPGLPVRTATQWEEVEYLVLAWTTQYQNIQRQIVQAAVKECKVLIATTNENSVKNYLTSNGVDLTNVRFINAATNSIWIRDYAANTVYTNDVGDRALVDWIYNRPRPLDNVLSTKHAEYVGVPLYVTDTSPNDLVNTGGNFMSDGMGNAFASKLILDENKAGNSYGVSTKTEAQVDKILKDYMGISSYRKMNVLPYDEIHHIDMHMKLLDEETLLVSQYPDGVADGPYIKQNIDYIRNTFKTPFGNDYDIKWIPAPASTTGAYPNTGGSYRTYTNAVIINKTILVPTYRPEVDVTALNIYKQSMPGYKVIGIDVDNAGEDLISLSGAIHCITHTIGVADPLLINHSKIKAVNNADVPVEAQIKHNSGIEQAKVFWRESGTSSFQEAIMTGSSENKWITNLSLPPGSKKIEYYIWAKAKSGKMITRPIVAPDGYWSFDAHLLSVEDTGSKSIEGPFPNPASNKVYFNLKNISGDVNISIHNILGQKLSEQKNVAGNGAITLDLNPKWSGVLLISFEGKFGKVIKKLIKKSDLN
ncbi:agmatine deiminase family protein [Epilithonimonas mollis]|uniref:Por secretion system C-terminal sorting domain-containing protein n=1 Tax=Epilithonimonas mollis TaxID=216903 RepID=A0A1M6R3V5_9FLAO|nr:agmatine deiminase family protein [Epilithonimonas mollis]SHK27008.1 Por secretion system C-terminal sorting domain-containing protein [Epilithonimonas mollis]